MKNRIVRPTGLIRPESVELDLSSANGDDEEPKWIQVAKAGAYGGHSQGAFEFTQKTFEQIVKNFRAHPSFTGYTDVVPFDFHHASEQDSTSGTIATSGAPAQAWAQNLDIRQGVDGKPELWALTHYLEPAKTYVREGRYRWTSVAVWFDSVDPITGRDIGPTLTSIAFTNQPFIRGMVPIAATARGLTMIENKEEQEPSETKEEQARREDMDIKLLAVKLGVQDTEDAIMLALDAGAKAKSKLETLLQALGVQDDGAIERVAQLMRNAAELESIMPEIGNLRKWKAEAEEQAIVQDVEQAIAAHALPSNLKDVLKLYRQHEPAKFAETYPKRPIGTEYMTQSLTTAPESQAVAKLSSQTFAAPKLGSNRVNLDGVTGRNRAEKAFNFVKALPENQKLSFDDLHAKAWDLLRSGAIGA